MGKTRDYVKKLRDNKETFHAEMGLIKVQWLRLSLPVQRVGVQSLVGELRRHMPSGQKKTNIKKKKKENCNKFNKDF